MEAVSSLLLILVAIGLIALFIRLFRRPLRFVLKILLNGVMGFVALFFFNILGGFIGLRLGLNWLNAIVVGVLGLPGVVLLLLIQYLL